MGWTGAWDFQVRKRAVQGQEDGAEHGLEVGLSRGFKTRLSKTGAELGLQVGKGPPSARQLRGCIFWATITGGGGFGRNNLSWEATTEPGRLLLMTIFAQPSFPLHRCCR